MPTSKRASVPNDTFNPGSALDKLTGGAPDETPRDAKAPDTLRQPTRNAGQATISRQELQPNEKGKSAATPPPIFSVGLPDPDKEGPFEKTTIYFLENNVDTLAELTLGFKRATGIRKADRSYILRRVLEKLDVPTLLKLLEIDQ